MTKSDQAALTMLRSVAETIAVIDGPISSRVASGLLLIASDLLGERRAPISMATVDAIVALVTALRADITA